MSNTSLPTQDDLPSLQQLGRSTVIALLVATALMVTVVLPAEYGRDPTRIGTLLGLTEMGRIKQSLAQEAALDAQHTQEAVTAPPSTAAPASAPADTTSPVEHSDEKTITLDPDQATEIKLTLNQGQKATFKWTSTGIVNYDIHGDSQAVNYHSYGKGAKAADEGVIVAKFAGNHGWYWRNRTSEPITLTLTTHGTYSDIKRMD